MSSKGWYVQQETVLPGKEAETIERVSIAIIQNKMRVIDSDLKAYFDNVRHHKV